MALCGVERSCRRRPAVFWGVSEVFRFGLISVRLNVRRCSELKPSTFTVAFSIIDCLENEVTNFVNNARSNSCTTNLSKKRANRDGCSIRLFMIKKRDRSSGLTDLAQFRVSANANSLYSFTMLKSWAVFSC